MKRTIQNWQKNLLENKLYYTIVANILLCILVKVLILSPLQEQSLHWQEQKNAYIKKCTNLQDYGVSAREYRELKTAELAKLEILANKLPEEREQLQIIKALHSSFKDEQVKIERLNLQNKNTLPTGYTEYLADCRAQGSYLAWQKLFAKLQAEEAVDIRISTINVNEQGDLRIALQLVYYALK